MTETVTTVQATDTDALIQAVAGVRKARRADRRRTGRKIAVGQLHRWKELPSLAVLADEYDVTERAITSVKSASRSRFPDIGEPAIPRRLSGVEMMRDWQPDVICPDLSTPAGLRIMLAARYQHLVLKFTVPPVSEKFEVSWIGGSAVGDSEDELLAKVLEAMQDCGGGGHLWITESEKRDPVNRDSLLLTQRLKCIYCDERERVISVHRPHRKVSGEG